jgi:hypothetical protein
VNGWTWLAVYYVVAAAGFGIYPVMGARDRTAKGLPVASPLGQFVFTVLAAPLTLAIAAAFAWSILVAALGLLARR